MITLYDKDFTTKYGAISSLCEAFVEEERNGLFELSFIMLNTDSLFNYVKEENIVVINANDTLLNQKFRIYMTRKLMNNRVEVYARHISFDLMYDYIDNVSFENQSCEYALNQLFRNSNFSKHYRGYSDIVNAQNYSMSMANVLEAIGGKEGSIIDTFGTGAEILRDNENIHVLNKRGHDNGVTIEYRKNLTGFELEEDTTDLITRILPYAKYNNSETNEEIIVKADYVDSPLIANYSHPYIKSIDYSDKFENGEISTVSKLQELAKKEYKDNKVDIPKQNFKIEFVPLSKCVGYDGLEDKISLCDVVTIIDTRYNIKTQSKVIKTVFNVLKNRYESIELGEPRTSLGDIVGNGNNEATVGPQGPPGPPGADGSVGDFPNSLPATPVVTTKVYDFANIEVSWTFENKVYYQYEVYASKEADFTPNIFYLVHQGQTSSFMYQAKPNETWYFKVCAINSHGNRTSFGSASANTVKIEDLSNYVEEMAINDALIGTLNLGRGWFGELKGNYIDAKNLSVTDGNGKRTLDIDSFGNVSLDVTEFKVKSEGVVTSNDLSEVIEEERKAIQDKIDFEVKELNSSVNNVFDYIDGAYKDGILDENEKKILKSELSNLEKEKNDVIAQVDSIQLAEEIANTSELTYLINSKNAFVSSHSDLVDQINSLLNVDSLNMKIHFIDTKVSGDCILIQYNSKNILIDSNEEEVADNIINYLKNNKVTKLDYIIATHHHSDHTGGMTKIINAFDVTGCIAYHRSIDFSKLPSYEIGWGTKDYHDKFVSICNSKGITLKTPTEKERLVLSADTYLEFYNTNTSNYNNYNNFSICTLVYHQGKKYFLGGDICTQSQTNILNSVMDVDVYKAQHHDYDYDMNEAFIDKLNPEKVIITNFKKHGNNQARAISGYCQFRGIPYYLCNGTIILTSNSSGYYLSTNIRTTYTNAWWDRNNTKNWYYFKANGSYAKNESLVIDNKTYNFDNTGLCTNPY